MYTFLHSSLRQGRAAHRFKLHQVESTTRLSSAALATATGDKSIALVSGASRGLGLEYVRQLLDRQGQSVIAACRDPEGAKGLQELRESHGDRLQTVQMDITNTDSIDRAVEHVSGITGHLDLLVNATGILHSKSMSPETALSRLEPDNMLTNFKINAMGPILVAKAFMPLLQSAAEASNATSEHPAVIASMSARVGSIGDNTIGGWHSYRASKSALNQFNKCMSIEVARRKHKVACIVLHPGTVDTDLSKPFQKNIPDEQLFSRERAIRQLLEIIEATTLKDTGRFIAWDGKDIPW